MRLPILIVALAIYDLTMIDLSNEAFKGLVLLSIIFFVMDIIELLKKGE